MVLAAIPFYDGGLVFSSLSVCSKTILDISAVYSAVVFIAVFVIVAVGVVTDN